MSRTKVIICPYCGDTQPLSDRCRACLGLFEPLSRQASHNAMGPWFVRNLNRLFGPGCSYETLVRMIERGQVVKNTIVRGPTTRQFWTIARRVPGIAHLLGYCHNCDASVDPGDHGCHACGVPFGAYLDRNFLGLPDVKPLPWEAPTIDSPARASSARGMEWHRAAEPVGLSSFASDEDLRSTSLQPSNGAGSGMSSLGDGDEARAAIAASARATVGSATALAAERTAVAAQTIPAGESSAALRALRRKLDQQQQTIRTLIIGLAVAGVVILVTVIAMLARPAAPGAPADSNSSGHAPSSHASAPLTPPASTQSDREGAVESAATQPEPGAAIQPAEDVQLQLGRAAELMAEAAKTDRLIADRVRDLQQAHDILQSIAKSVPASAQPADLQVRIEQVDTELERLRLKELFP